MNYCRTDLACEIDLGRLMPEDGESVQDECGGVTVNRLCIKSEGLAARLGKPRGVYVTLGFDKVQTMSDETFEKLEEVLARTLREMAERATGKTVDDAFGVLVAGLGNEEITPDAIGPMTVKRITVTRHVKRHYPSVYQALKTCELSALVPGVLGQTGIETVELIRGAVENVRPDLVVAVDALVARSCDRLAATVQLSDTGLQPGSGIGNHRKAICRDTLGVPVISVGVPTVVNSATLVYDALAQAGIEKPSEELLAVLENGKSFFVSPKESDLIVRQLSTILAGAVEAAFATV